MPFKVKRFTELTLGELYEILRTRAEIFVVEQDSPYQDLDGTYYESLHVFSEEGGRVTSYLRIFKRDEDTAQIGRVVTLKHGTGLGGKLLREGIEQAKQKFCPRQIYLEVQCYAAGYYAREGFVVCSDEFLLDGIPHYEMILKL